VLGRLRCALHGGASTSARTADGKERQVEALQAGRTRWVERMREAKARGELERFPGGRRKRDLPPLAKDPIIRRAQRFIEAMMSGRELTEGEARPWPTLSKAEKLGAVTDVALDIAREILALGVDPRDTKILQIVKDTALSVISNQIRVDTAVLVASVSAPGGLTEEQRREQARQAIAAAFAERPQRGTGIVVEPEPGDRKTLEGPIAGEVESP